MDELIRKYAIYYIIMDKQLPYLTSSLLFSTSAYNSCYALLKSKSQKRIPDLPIAKAIDHWFMPITEDETKSIWIEARTNQFWVGEINSNMVFGTEETECICS